MPPFEYKDVLVDAICHQGFYVIDDFLETKDYLQIQNIIKTKRHTGHFKTAQIGHGTTQMVQSTIRNDEICWFDDDANSQSLHTYLSQIEQLRLIFNETLFLGLHSLETHFSVYPVGHFYRKHIDQFKNNNDRRISTVYYLNDDWKTTDGGELLLYDSTSTIAASVAPIGNRLICFNSDIPHEVSITNRIRYSIAGWLRIRNIQPEGLLHHFSLMHKTRS